VTQKTSSGIDMNSEITAAIERLQQGDPGAMEHLYEVSYGELKQLAHSRVWAANLGHSFSTESLLHESYLRLVNQKTLAIPDRKHFFAYASRVMRTLIVDEVREANAIRRGGGQADVTLNTEIAAVSEQGGDVQAIDDALSDLQRASPELAALVEMRFFGGMTEAEIADVLSVSERTVRRQWEKARAALIVLLEGERLA
jgi:RNA polymerase sigma factor (TIGR02999 family)